MSEAIREENISSTDRSSHPEVFLGEGALKICSKVTGQHPCQSVISIKLQSNFIEFTLGDRCSPVNFCIFSEHLFLRTPLGGCFCTELHKILQMMEKYRKLKKDI